jgi:hypothetical protein
MVYECTYNVLVLKYLLRYLFVDACVHQPNRKKISLEERFADFLNLAISRTRVFANFGLANFNSTKYSHTTVKNKVATAIL